LAAALAASPLERAARAEASSALLQRPRPERCETIVDDGELALPDDPATRARAGEVEHELDRAWAAYGLGRYRDAKAIVDAVDPIASALDVPALRAQLLVVAGAIAGRIGDPASARGVLERALVAAARAHAPELELAVWSRLLRHELFAGVPQRTIEYSAFASAAAARAGRDGAELDGVVAEALLDAGQPAAARERIERALASHDPLRDDQRALLELDHGAIELAMGHAPKAEAALTRALELARGALGDEHPTLALYLDKLADAARARGKLRDALALHDRSVELRRRAFGDGDRAVATARFHRAETLLEAGQLTRAALDLDAAREIRQRAYGERSPRLGELEALAGELAAARGEIAAARAHYAAAAALDPRLELTALRLAAGERAPGGDVAITEPFSVDHVAALAARIAQLPPDHGQPLARTLLDRWRAAGPVDPALAIAVADALAATHADADAIATYRSALAALGDEPSRSRLQVLRVLVAMHAEPAATLAPLTAAMPELR
ncbi:MAG TPA: tetratricopeptide repeat protein, partial [Kofleriaceae bacterium]|nr:tetratricopeptide repeat protein [Kofleriaceae bacterium]